jgi:N-acetylglucosamine repressor
VISRKLDSENIGKSNRRLVLQLLRKNQITTRRDLASVSGLNPSTVTKIIREFLLAGLCEEISTEVTDRIGRKAIELRLNRKAYVSIVVDIGVEETSIGKGYFDGTTSTISSFSTPSTFEEFTEVLVEKTGEVVKKIPKYKFLGYSISVPGMVDVERSKIVYVPHLGWKDVFLKDSLSKRYPVVLDNEANLSLIAEKWNNPGLAGLGDIVFVYVSEGIGCGIMLGGQIHRGRDYSAGEIGHMTVQLDGPKCYCGNSGCWETFASSEAIVRKAQSEGLELKGSNNNERYLDILKNYEKSEYSFLIEEIEKSLAVGIVNIVNSLDPEVIVLGGVASMLPEEALKRLTGIVNSRVLYATGQNIEVRRSILDTHGKTSSNMIGAALHIIERRVDDFI